MPLLVSKVQEGLWSCGCFEYLDEYRWSPLFVDWGTYRYNGDPKYRVRARSTMSHNTITIDNIDQSEMTGPFYGETEQNVKLSNGMLKTVSLKLITMDIKIPLGMSSQTNPL